MTDNDQPPPTQPVSVPSTPPAWHVPAPLLAAFAADPGGLDTVTAASVEAHLMACAGCRRDIATAAGPAVAAASWDAVADRIDRPHPRLVERLLGRLGVGNGISRLLAATPALQAAGLAAVTGVAVLAVVASRSLDAAGPFLVLAPLVPLAAVALSFAPTVDPAGEVGVGTPLHGAGLVVRRAAAVLGVSFGVLGAAALALPDLGGAVAWVLPSLALVLGALALATWMRAEVAVAGLAGGWLATVWSAWWVAGRDVTIADSATFAAAGQTVALATAAAALAVLVARHDRFATLEAFR